MKVINLASKLYLNNVKIIENLMLNQNDHNSYNKAIIFYQSKTAIYYILYSYSSETFIKHQRQSILFQKSYKVRSLIFYNSYNVV